MTPVWHPSPNFSSRRGDARPSLVVLHYTGMATASAALARLCDPVAEVSAHYLIAETGVVTALVAEEMRAWHAGAGEWAGITDVNSHSIGIELANDGAEPFAHRQMQALEQMLRGIRARWKIAPNRIIGHSDMAPTRKRDPGPRFDWRRLALQGLSVWPDATEKTGETADFTADLLRFGYPDASPAVLLKTFRLRFRPAAFGPLDGTDLAMISDLSRRFPVDGQWPSA